MCSGLGSEYDQRLEKPQSIFSFLQNYISAAKKAPFHKVFKYIFYRLVNADVDRPKAAVSRRVFQKLPIIRSTEKYALARKIFCPLAVRDTIPGRPFS